MNSRTAAIRRAGAGRQSSDGVRQLASSAARGSAVAGWRSSDGVRAQLACAVEERGGVLGPGAQGAHALLQEDDVWLGEADSTEVLGGRLLALDGIVHGALHVLELLHAGVHDLQGGVVLAVRDGALALPVLLDAVVGLCALAGLLGGRLLGLELGDGRVELLLLLALVLVRRADLLLPVVVHALQ